MLEREVVSDMWGQGGRGRTWSRMLRPSRRVGYRHLARQVAALLIVPGGLVVRPRRRIKARVQTVLREFEALLNHEGRVGVMSEVFFGDPIVLNRVVDHAAEEGDVRPGTNLEQKISDGSGAREPPVHHDHLVIADFLLLY